MQTWVLVVIVFSSLSGKPVADAKRASVVQRKDGLWAIGIADDAPGPFPSRACAEAVAREMAA
jgi:hypothetical protein